MSEKTAPLPSSPADESFQQAPPPPYTPYPTLPESDPTKPYPSDVGFKAPPQPQPQTVTTTVVQHVVITPVPLGPFGIRMHCPHCQTDISTSTVKQPSLLAYISAVALFLVGCAFGCCLIPFCMDSCKTTEHHCPKCKRFIGKYSRF